MGSSQLAALDAIEHYALSRPHSPALLEPDGLKLSYKELWAQVQMLSDRLEEAGIGAGERVAVLLPEGGLHVLAVTGVLNRHVVILLSTRTAPTVLEPTLRKLSASALIAAPEFEAEIEVATRLGLTVLVPDKGESPRDWEIRATAFPFNKSLVRSGPGLFLFSSGTTGASKVVFWSDANINAGIASRQRSAQLTGSDRLLLMITLCNGAGIINALTQFAAGGSIIATNGFDHSAYVSWLNELKPTWYVCAPIVHQASLAALREGVIDRPVSLRFLESAGAPLNKEVRQGLEQILGVPVLNVYGANEVQYVVRKTPSSGGLDANPDSAGVSCGLEISIMDSFGMFLPTGEEGEIVVRGPTVVFGYVDNPEGTRAAFQDGWFKTGDAGRLDEKGNLFVTGRLKEMINRGGEKILPGEVDAVFESYPSVLEAAAFAVPHPTLGEDMACAVVLRTGTESEVSARELRRYATEHLASFKVPHRIYFVDEIPRGELGKPQRWMLAEQLSRRDGAISTVAEISQEIDVNGVALLVLHEIWSRILGREDLRFDEDFFEAGGDSLAVLNMLAEVDQRYDSHTSAAAARFVDEPTLTNLRSLVGDAEPALPKGESSDLQIFPVSEGNSGTRMFCFTPHAVEGLSFRRLAKYLGDEMDISIVRPANTLYSYSLFTFENMAARADALIRQVQPQGPYLLAGNCAGGVLAAEVAREFRRQGQEARVILFDTPLPGFPAFIHDWKVWATAVGRQWKRLWTSEHPGLIGNLRRFRYRILWSAMSQSRRLLAPVQNIPLVQRAILWTEDHAGVGPLCWSMCRPLHAPCLHFLGADEPRFLSPTDVAARFGWRSYARRGIEEHYLPCDHFNMLHESNLPAIADTLKKWCSIQSEAAPCQDHPAQEVGMTEVRH